jgi:hypothetical protein
MEDELYDLGNDPDEIENLNSSQKSISQEMGAELAQMIEQAQEPG